MTKCFSCGYLHYDTLLNCPKCGSFYTEIIEDVLSENDELQSNNQMDKTKLKPAIANEVHND